MSFKEYIHFRNIKLEPIQNFLANNFNNQETKETEIDRNTEILNQLRLDCLNNKKKILLHNFATVLTHTYFT